VIRPLVIKHTEIYSGRIHLLVLTLASVFIIASGGLGRVGGIVFIIAYLLYLRHSISSFKDIFFSRSVDCIPVSLTKD